MKIHHSVTNRNITEKIPVQRQIKKRKYYWTRRKKKCSNTRPAKLLVMDIYKLEPQQLHQLFLVLLEIINTVVRE